MNLKRAVFLDRDGTLNHDVGYTHKIEDLRLLDGVVEGLQLMAKMGFSLIVTTNQAGIARGYFTEQQMHEFNQHLIEVLEYYGINIDGIYFCPYHATAGLGSYKRESTWRKPQAGMIIQAAKDHQIDLSGSYAIGDKKSDIIAGKNAGCTSILVLTGVAGNDESKATSLPDYVARDLLEAATIIKDAETIKMCS